MTLATADDEGRPSARMVLLKDVDVDGFVFYTNLGSRKALELNANPHAALCFYWKSLAKQVRVEGVIELVADAEADAYFASRPKLSQLGGVGVQAIASLGRSNGPGKAGREVYGEVQCWNYSATGFLVRITLTSGAD